MVGLLTVLLGLGVVSSWGIPRLTQERIEQNQRHAMDLLHMVQASRSEIQAHESRIPTFWDLAGFSQLEAPLEGARRLMPKGFRVRGNGAVLRAGYFFREQTTEGKVATGCWAWPTLEDYSGRKIFWLSYDSGDIFVVAEEAMVKVGHQTPTPEDLLNIVPE